MSFKSNTKIAIFGSYNGGSIGDTAILIGLISSIYRVFGNDTEIRVLAMGEIRIADELIELNLPNHVEEIIIVQKFNSLPFGFGTIFDKIWRYHKRANELPPFNISRIREAMDGVDVLLVGGGNLVMDLYKSWPSALRMICQLASDSGTPYCFVGIGAAPIKTIEGRRDLVAALKSAQGVFFRDAISKRYCEKRLDFYKSKVGPDLAFGVKYKNDCITNKSNELLVNIAAVYSEKWPEKNSQKYNRYLFEMVSIVDRLVSEFCVEKVKLFITNYPLDQIAAEDFIKRYRESRASKVSLSFIKGRKSVGQLLKECSMAKLSLVTRLHAGILCRISGTPVLAIEYQPKVRNVLENQTSNCIVESFDSLLSGSAFRHICEDSLIETSVKYEVDHKNVDGLLLQVLDQCDLKID